MSIIIGIDLGTSHSVIAGHVDGQLKIFLNSEGNQSTPSVVTLCPDGTWLVGERAKALASQYPENTIFAIKRLIGRKFQDVSVQNSLPLLPYKVVPGSQGDAWVEICGKLYSPIEISAKILQKLKWDAEAFSQKTITEAVVTAPAYFTHVQRQAIKDAGTIAGLHVRRIVNEPTAAALAYGLHRGDLKMVLVFSFGAGSLDISIVHIGDGVCEVIATRGDTQLGGHDIDQCVVQEMIRYFHAEQGIDLSRNSAALQRLRTMAEDAKIVLSSAMTTEMHVPYVVYDASGPKHFHMMLTRKRLEEITAAVLSRIQEPLVAILGDNHYYRIETWSQVSDVVLVGGQTRMPAVEEYVQRVTGKKAHRTIDPDAIVALGAARQGGIMHGEIKERETLLLDVCSFSLGVETMGGAICRMIDRNTTLPTEKRELFTTVTNTQTELKISVFQGEHGMAKDNLLLGSMMLRGIPAVSSGEQQVDSEQLAMKEMPSDIPPGLPQIEISMDIDGNHVVNVRAKVENTGIEQSMVVTPESGLTQSEVSRMSNEANVSDKEHRAKREIQQRRDAAYEEAKDASKVIRELSTLIATDQRDAIEHRIAAVHCAIDAADITSLEVARQSLQKAYYSLASSIYRNLYGSRTPYSTSVPTASQIHIFVSHSHADNLYSREFVEVLIKARADVWYDENDLQLGELTPKIERQLIERQVFIPLLTPSSLKSPWVLRETEHFHALYLHDQSRIVLPVIAGAIGNSAIWPFLRDFKRIEGQKSLPVAATEAAQQALRTLVRLL